MAELYTLTGIASFPKLTYAQDYDGDKVYKNGLVLITNIKENDAVLKQLSDLNKQLPFYDGFIKKGKEWDKLPEDLKNDAKDYVIISLKASADEQGSYFKNLHIKSDNIITKVNDTNIAEYKDVLLAGYKAKVVFSVYTNKYKKHFTTLQAVLVDLDQQEIVFNTFNDNDITNLLFADDNTVISHNQTKEIPF